MVVTGTGVAALAAGLDEADGMAGVAGEVLFPAPTLFFPNLNVHFEGFLTTALGCWSCCCGCGCGCVPDPDPTEGASPVEVLNRDGVLCPPSPTLVGLLNNAEGSAYIDTGSYLLLALE